MCSAAETREAVDEQGEQRAVPQADDRRDVDAVEQLLGFVAVVLRIDRVGPSATGENISALIRNNDEPDSRRSHSSHVSLFPEV
jgi:hypothetical protein